MIRHPRRHRQACPRLRAWRGAFEPASKSRRRVFLCAPGRSRRFICAPLQQELESKDSTPERAAFRDWITFRILDLLPDPVELHFHPAVHRPVHSNREGFVACQENVLRTRISKR